MVTDELLMKKMYTQIGLRFYGKQYAKQRVFMKALLKTYQGEDISDVIDYCEAHYNHDFKSTYFLKVNLEKLIPISKAWKELQRNKQEEIEEVFVTKRKETKRDRNLF